MNSQVLWTYFVIPLSISICHHSSPQKNIMPTSNTSYCLAPIFRAAEKTPPASMMFQGKNRKSEVYGPIFTIFLIIGTLDYIIQQDWIKESYIGLDFSTFLFKIPLVHDHWYLPILSISIASCWLHSNMFIPYFCSASRKSMKELDMSPTGISRWNLTTSFSCMDVNSRANLCKLIILKMKTSRKTCSSLKETCTSLHPPYIWFS